MKDQASIFSQKPACPAKMKPAYPAQMFANETLLDELQDTELKRRFINFIKEFKEIKKDTKKQLNKIKEKA